MGPPQHSEQERHDYSLPVIAAYVAGFIALAAIAFVVYWPGLHGGFFFDDQANILLPEGIRMDRLTLENIKAALASGHSGVSGRSIAQISFAANYFFSGFSSFAFKATNLAIHLANTLLVFVFAKRLLSANQAVPSQPTHLLAPVLLATVWCLHPIQLTSILLVVQRMTSLSAFFLLSGMLFHMSGRERKGYACAGYLFAAWCVCWPLSFFCKENGVLFPLFVVAWEVTCRRPSAKRHFDLVTRCLCVIVGLLIAAGFEYAISSAGHWLWSGYEFRQFSPTERLMTEARVLWLYLRLIAFPSLEALGLHHDDLIISRSLLSPRTTLPAIVGLCGLIWLAWRMRNRAALASFGILWYLVGHSLESTILPLEIAHEHRNYLPLFGILLMGTAGLQYLSGKSGPARTTAVTLTAVALSFFLFVTSLRSHQFGDDIRRTQIEAQHHRGSARAQYEAGQQLATAAATATKDAPIFALTRKHFELATELDPAFKFGLLGLIFLNCASALPPEQTWIQQLTARLEKTPFPPGETALFYSLKEWAINGELCLDRKQVDSLFGAASGNPRISQATKAKLHSWHADYLWLKERDIAAARASIAKSLALVPSSPSNRLKMAQLIVIAGDNDAQALQIIKELRKEELSQTERNTLGGLLVRLNRKEP